MNSGSFTISGTASFAAVTNAANPTSIYVNAGNLIANSGSTINFLGGSPSAYSFIVQAGGSYTFSGNTVFGNANYAFRAKSGSNVPLVLNGCTVFKAGTATLDVVNGNLTTLGAGGLNFNPPSGTTCGASVTFAASNTYTLQVQSGGSFTVGSAATDPASFGPANYGFNNGSVTLNETAMFPAGTTNVNIANGNLITATASTLNFTGGSASKYAFAVQASSGAYTIGGNAVFGTGSPTAPFYAFYNGGTAGLTASSNVSLAPANYYLDSGPLALNGCTAVQSGTSTINVNAGNLTTLSTGNITFNPERGPFAVPPTPPAPAHTRSIPAAAATASRSGDRLHSMPEPIIS